MPILGVKIVIVPDQENGIVKIINDHPGSQSMIYNHILIIYDDGTFKLIAAIAKSFGQHGARTIALGVSYGLPIETDPDFYKKLK